VDCALTTMAGPVTVSRVESATGWWEFVRNPASRPLAGLVAGRCGYREQAHGVLRRRMPASSVVPIVLSFGDRLDVLDVAGDEGAGRSYGSFVAGLHPGPAVTQFAGTQYGLQVDLTPLGAYRILGVPGSALAHRITDLAQVAPGLAGTLTDRLSSLSTWEQRFLLIDQVLLRMASRGPKPDPLVHWMWGQLEASGGRVRIADLVNRSGWSHRHVTSRFREQVGLTPKSAAKVVRFERAAAHLTCRAVSLADVATRYGYADQSHLTREFTRLAGDTPALYTTLPSAGPGHRERTLE
jgi:AraC-like DNA-binding protein